MSPIEEELLSVVAEGEREGALDRGRREMIENVLGFPKSDASQIMTPRTDIIGIEAGATIDEARRLIASSGHSRIPVTRGNIDTIVGILYAKDLLDRPAVGEGQPPHVKDVCRAPSSSPRPRNSTNSSRSSRATRSTWRSSWTSTAARPAW